MPCIKWKFSLFDARFFFFTVGLTCISKHDDFEAVVLLKSTNKVALHDRKSCGLEKRTEIFLRRLTVQKHAYFA